MHYKKVLMTVQMCVIFVGIYINKKQLSVFVRNKGKKPQNPVKQFSLAYLSILMLDPTIFPMR
jgi:hypothetical protein